MRPWQSVPTAGLPRARRILHALAHAAQHHGFTLTPAPPDTDASVEITARGGMFSLQFDESHTEEYDTDSVRYSWQRITTRTTRPSHQLDLHLPHSWGHRGRRSRWGDRQRWRLEDKLPQLLAEIDHRARHEEEHRLARQREEEETRRRWQAAMEHARHDLLHAHRLTALREQTEAWHEASRVDVLACGTSCSRRPDPAALRTAGRPPLTVVPGRGDDVRFTRTALAAHDPVAGRIVVHPTVVSHGKLLWSDILQASVTPRLRERGVPARSRRHKSARSTALCGPRLSAG